MAAAHATRAVGAHLCRRAQPAAVRRAKRHRVVVRRGVLAGVVGAIRAAHAPDTSRAPVLELAIPVIFFFVPVPLHTTIAYTIPGVRAARELVLLRVGGARRGFIARPSF